MDLGALADAAAQRDDLVIRRPRIADREIGRPDADTSAWFAILFAFAAPIGLWALLTFGG